jgi:hypothetical protein
MKKLVAVLAPLALFMSACTTTGTTTGTTETTPTTSVTTGLATAAVKIGVQAKCAVEIDKNATWQNASKVLTAEQQQSVKTTVCSCVADEVTTNVSAAELVVAAMDKTSQATLVTKVVTNSLNTCVVETAKQWLK